MTIKIDLQQSNNSLGGIPRSAEAIPEQRFSASPVAKGHAIDAKIHHNQCSERENAIFATQANRFRSNNTNLSPTHFPLLLAKQSSNSQEAFGQHA